jgi:uncharacterized protein (DUF2336 family)
VYYEQELAGMIVERFLNWSATAEASSRAKALNALARAYLAGKLPEGQAEAADAAMTAFLDDPEPEVRKALAQALAGHSRAPRHLVLSLAGDRPEIAMYVLARSPVFVDAELVEMVSSGNSAQQIAIACRPAVSPALTATIAETGDARACLGLLMHHGSDIAPDILQCIAERHASKVEIRNALEPIAGLNVPTRLILIDQYGAELRNNHQREAWLPEQRIEDLVQEFCDCTIIEMAGSLSEDELSELIEYLIKRRCLSTAFLLRAVCTGNIMIFARALGHLAQASAERVDSILTDDRQSVFRAIYLKAGLPDSAYEVFANAMTLWRRYLNEDISQDPAQLAHLVTRELVEAYSGKTDPQIDRLLVLLRKLEVAATRDNARIRVGQFRAGASGVEQIPHTETGGNASRKDFPVIDMSGEVLAHFASHFADEIVEMEAELDFSIWHSASGDRQEPVMAGTDEINNALPTDNVPLDKRVPAVDDVVSERAQPGRRVSLLQHPGGVAVSYRAA